MMDLKEYISTVNQKYRAGNATEHSYRGMTLSFDDVKHYGHIIYVLQQTERIMQEIDEIIKID